MWVILWYNNIIISNQTYAQYFSLARFLTMWGMFFTTFLFFLSLFLGLGCSKTTSKHSPFALWKWYIFIFELSLTLEIFITLFYWLVLYPSAPPKKTWLKAFGESINHALPFFCLMVEWAMNVIPFVKRHCSLLMVVCICYMVTNLVYTIKVKPVYP